MKTAALLIAAALCLAAGPAAQVETPNVVVMRVDPAATQPAVMPATQPGTTEVVTPPNSSVVVVPTPYGNVTAPNQTIANWTIFGFTLLAVGFAVWEKIDAMRARKREREAKQQTVHYAHLASPETAPTELKNRRASDPHPTNDATVHLFTGKPPTLPPP